MGASSKADPVILTDNARCSGKCGDQEICGVQIFHNGYCRAPADRDKAVLLMVTHAALDIEADDKLMD